MTRSCAVIAHPEKGPQREHDRSRRGRLLDRPDPARSSERPALGVLSRAQLRDLRLRGSTSNRRWFTRPLELDRVFVRARRVTLRLVARPAEHEPDVEVSYTLADGWPYLLVTTRFSNRGRDADRRRPAGLDSRRSVHSSRAPRIRPTCSGSTTGISARRMALLPKGTRSWERKPDGCCCAIAIAHGKVTVRLAAGETYR